MARPLCDPPLVAEIGRGPRSQVIWAGQAGMFEQPIFVDNTGRRATHAAKSHWVPRPPMGCDLLKKEPTKAVNLDPRKRKKGQKHMFPPIKSETLRQHIGVCPRFIAQ
jgi:hypothetical protein